jgi:hypothetical protein
MVMWNRCLRKILMHTQDLQMPQNRLATESSLYLRQHSANPVDWFPWGEEALAAARTQGKPIFLSIGYSACHWCHVMEHESFEDDATAAVLNAHFISIKVDREERPDLDQIYMTALQLLTREGGGWPLSVFLTPEGTPFHAGTYFPPQDAYGRPSFRRVLLAVAEAWRNQREQLHEVGQQVVEALNDHQSRAASKADLSERHLRHAVSTLKANHDPVHGGFGAAPKFPHPMDLRLLFKLAIRFNDDQARSIATHTLTMMARGGIYDHVGGGFARYSVDRQWLVPHFEKMLYDNALLVPCYLDAWQITGDVFFKQVAIETLDWLLKEMTSPAGAFYSTLDADSEGEEGKFYVWSEAEMDRVLGEDSAFAKALWHVTPEGNFEGHNILHRTASNDDDAQQTLARIKATLYAHRAKRIWPGRDEKILTAWNALAIAAFALAGRVLDSATYRDAAVRCARFTQSKLRRGDGRLWRTCGDSSPARLMAYLEDYAYLADALIELYQTDHNPEWIAWATELGDIILKEFAKDSGEFYTTAADHEALIVRSTDWHDGATPSGNAMAATAFAKLAVITGEVRFQAAADATLHAFSGLIESSPTAAAQMLTALDFRLGPTQEIVTFGDASKPDTQAWFRRLNQQFHPRRLTAFHDPATGAAPAHINLLKHREAVGGELTVYECDNGACREPRIGAAANGV